MIPKINGRPFYQVYAQAIIALFVIAVVAAVARETWFLLWHLGLVW